MPPYKQQYLVISGLDTIVKLLEGKKILICFMNDQILP